jgi:hypothetical protein
VGAVGPVGPVISVLAAMVEASRAGVPGSLPAG